MSDERPSPVLGALPRSRPQRRSDKRPATPPGKRSAEPAATRTSTPRERGSRLAEPPRKTATAAAATDSRPERLRQPAQPPGVPKSPRRATPPREPEAIPSRSTGREILGIAAQAAAELTEIGLSVSARALRNAVNRLPRP